MARPRQRTPELREKVLATALATLTSDGVSGFTTRKVALAASTSIPAVYELFGDRGGLVREMFFDGFRQLRRRFEILEDTADARADLVLLIAALRSFACENPVLAELMFSRPFADFDPRPEEQGAGTSVREFILARVRRCVETGVVDGNQTDISHVMLALALGMAFQEIAGWLGTSAASVDRRWTLAVDALLDGLAPRGKGTRQTAASHPRRKA